MPGERKMLSLFRKLLFPWEIYVQPPLNGLRPDFVALHPENGIAIFEVKDWDLRKRNYRYDGLPDPIDQLLGYKDEVFKSYCPSLYENKSFGLVTVVLVFPFSSRAELERVFTQSTLDSKGFLSSNYPKQYVLAGREDLQDNSRKSWFPIVELPNQAMSKKIGNELRLAIEPQRALWN